MYCTRLQVYNCNYLHTGKTALSCRLIRERSNQAINAYNNTSDRLHGAWGSEGRSSASSGEEKRALSSMRKVQSSTSLVNFFPPGFRMVQKTIGDDDECTMVTIPPGRSLVQVQNHLAFLLSLSLNDL